MDIKFFIPDDQTIPTQLRLLVDGVHVYYEKMRDSMFYRFEVYTDDADKAREIIEDCTRCPMCDAETDDCLLSPVYYRDWDEQYKNCPLVEKYQPNPFNSVVQLLRDFDIHDEEMIKDLADHICQMFKDGAYD